MDVILWDECIHEQISARLYLTRRQVCLLAKSKIDDSSRRVLNEQKCSRDRRPGQYQDIDQDRKSTRLNSSHYQRSRMPSSA